MTRGLSLSAPDDDHELRVRLAVQSLARDGLLRDQPVEALSHQHDLIA
jgi:hypothetical protein